MRCKGNLIRTIFIAVSVLFISACRSHEVFSVRTRPWSTGADSRFRDIGIGYFDYRGPGSRAASRDQFNHSLAFALRESGYLVKEARDVIEALKKNDLPRDRHLNSEEIVRLSGAFAGRLLLQGRLREKQDISLMKESTRIMIDVEIFDMRDGEKIGDIKLFVRDLSSLSGRESLSMARKIVRALERLIVTREKKSPEPSKTGSSRRK